MKDRCGFCQREVTVEHKMVCEKCFDFILRLVQTCENKLFETKSQKNIIKEDNKVKNKSKKKDKKGKRKIEDRKKIKETKFPEIETERQKTFKKATSDPVDLLTKCATCEFSFLEGTKISCTEEKDPKACGR